MTIRNLVIAAGAVVAAGSALAAPAMASAQGYYEPAYRAAPVYAPAAYGYGYERPRFEDYRRIEAHRYWEHRRFEAYRFHHDYRPYRGW